MDGAGFEFGSEGPTGVGLTEVAGNNGHRDAVIAGEFFGQALEPVRSASDEHERRLSLTTLSEPHAPLSRCPFVAAVSAAVSLRCQVDAFFELFSGPLPVRQGSPPEPGTTSLDMTAGPRARTG